ncbi:Protein of uncharacterised function (DUF466) [Actinomyces bovis]|uniref:Protein of uncharacterized function (DUF466) n=1 Tax=Actinomyces bovis TaxID=1658 RepID=A0ABY1VQG7_9ACTO|nr:YbdD/YjiX family protein [Actinomyces bovis]SPT54375.1 Protein of uncharacterised function (DUF466) [Actinomyces bovis]VEG56085.1 Protein of uncharacterised function (DUF466) [Actinomyces israelii]
MRALPVIAALAEPPAPSPAAADCSGGSTASSRRGWVRRLQGLREGLREARALWRDFTGESAYERYVERHRREHPDHEPLTERQWWRARAAFDEENVSTGCC